MPLKLQYVDYAVWQRHSLTDDTLQVHLNYWREKLSGLEVLALATDYPRLKAQRFLGAYRSIELPDALLHRLGQLVSPQGNTVFMGLLAVFKILLSRYAGQADIAVGVPIANRTLLSTEDIVGTFVNTLVMRTDLGGTPTFREVLSRVRETAVAAYEHQDLPFERLVEELSPARDASRAPLVQVLFNVANAPIGAIELHKLTWESFEFDAGAAQFDLSLTVDIEVTKKAFLAYRTDLFDGATIERMIEQYRRLLEEALEDPDKSMTDYQILSHEDRHLIQNEWNETSAPYPHVKVLPELVAAQVRLTPAAIAVAMDGKTLTYAALEAQSNQLANYLGRKGVTRGDLVGICLDRSPTMVVGLLAIMKAGAAYVPLDPGYPKHRLNYMVQDSGIHTIVTLSSLADHLPREGRDLLCLDREGDRISRESAATATGPAPADVAYVIYTSGSTGQPKGVVICHRSLVNFLWSMKRCPGCTARDLLLSVTTLSFDIAGLELFLPLHVGDRWR